MTIRSVVFDAYGTLFDVNAAARHAAQEPGFEALAETWPKLANDWRTKQLQYTWLRAITRDHCDFWQVTKEALDWSMEASGLRNDTRLRDRLLELYRTLDTFPEVPEMLAKLKAECGEGTLLQRPQTCQRVQKQCVLFMYGKRAVAPTETARL